MIVIGDRFFKQFVKLCFGLGICACREGDARGGIDPYTQHMNIEVMAGRNRETNIDGRRRTGGKLRGDAKGVLGPQRSPAQHE